MKISAIIADANGALLTGKAASTALKILRAADGYLFDWSDLTFKASGWGSLTAPLIEVDSTNLPGAYQKEVTVTAWADGFYLFQVHFDDATTVLNFQGEQYVQGGQEIEAGVVEGSITLKVALRRILSVLVGKANGGGTGTQHYRDTGDTVNRVTAAVDADGNRTAVTFDDSGA